MPGQKISNEVRACEAFRRHGAQFVIIGHHANLRHNGGNDEKGRNYIAGSSH